MTKFPRLLALVLVIALMASLVVPGFAVDASEGCQCNPNTRKGKKVSTVAPTCSDYGYDVYVCNKCGKQYTQNLKLPTYDHDLVYVDAKPATCTEDGWDAYEYCLNCDYSTYEAIPSTGHTPVEVPAYDPDCENDGHTMVVYCGVCFEVLVPGEVIPALGHVEGNPVIENVVKSVDGKPGSYEKVVYCTVCEKELSRELITNEHFYGFAGPKEIKPADCVNPEIHVYECLICGFVLEQPVGKPLGHKWAAATCTEAKTCTVCGTTSGNPLGHNYKAVVTKPTCVEEGYTTHTCSRCKDSYVDSETPIDPLAHEHGITKPYQAPTCEEDGWTAEVGCFYCDHVLSASEVIPALGHKYTGKVTKPTCTEEGYTTYTCSTCKASYKDDYVAALGHLEYGTRGYVNPNCVEDGYWIAKCYRCVTFIVWDNGTATGHNYETIVTDPTCTEKGYTTYICTNPKNENEACLHTYVDNYVDELGHTPGKWAIENLVEATCTEKGSYDEVQYCDVCYAEIVRNNVIVPEFGHVVIEATCTTESFCRTCREVLAPALGHVEIVVPGYSATFDEAGLSDGCYCDRCQEVLVEQEVIDPISEEITFSYKAYGINGSANAVNSGYITVEVWMNVNTEIARLWAVDVDVHFNSSMTLLSVAGCIFEQNLATPLDIANQLNAVKLTQDMGYSGDKTFEQGEYLFATLTFKVDKDFYSEDAAFIVNVEDCAVTRKGEFANAIVADFGEGVEIHVNMLGDANLDGKITSADTMALSTWFETADLESYDTIFDMNKDGFVDGDDFALLRGAVVRDYSYLEI